MASELSSFTFDMSPFASASFAEVSFQDEMPLAIPEEDIDKVVALLEATNYSMDPADIQRAVEADPDLCGFLSGPAPSNAYDTSTFSPTASVFSPAPPTFEEIFPPQTTPTSFDLDFNIDLEALGISDIPMDLPEFPPDLQTQLEELNALMDEYDGKGASDPIIEAVHSPAPSPPGSFSDVSSDPDSPSPPALSVA